MIIFRLTSKLSKKMKIEPASGPQPVSTSLLGDWYCNLVTIQRKPLILCVSQRTLLPIVLEAKDVASFPQRLTSCLEELLTAMNISPELIREEIGHMQNYLFAKTDSRQILGSMNDFTKMLEVALIPGKELRELSWFLGDTPCSPLKMLTPLEVTAPLFQTPIPKVQKLPTARPQLRLIKS